MSTASETTDRQRCSVCGTENDPFYTYCRQCLAALESETTGSSIV
ncbi:DUF7577 domain-containing protein [Natrinema zhouii]|nr:hypothetical protein [Natrinema zhouii]